MRKPSIILVAAVLFVLGAAASFAEAATSFNGSTITAIDQNQRTITFKTREGESWTLPLADPDILKKQQFAQGDRVSIEIDLDDRITKILKSAGSSAPSPSGPRDDMNQ